VKHGLAADVDFAYDPLIETLICRGDYPVRLTCLTGLLIDDDNCHVLDVFIIYIISYFDWVGPDGFAICDRFKQSDSVVPTGDAASRSSFCAQYSTYTHIAVIYEHNVGMHSHML
jgi:hypothetical protein